MKKTGYVIAKNKGLNEFFTSSSAYDRPRWVSIAEATTYPTAELAERASTKLYKSSGAYEARAVPVQSLMESRGRDMSYTEPPYDDSEEDDSSMSSLPFDVRSDTGETVDKPSEMVAGKQGTDPSIDPEADDEFGLETDRPEDDEDQDDIEDMVDQELGDENMGDQEFGDEDMDLDDGTVGMSGEDDEIEGAPDVGFDEELPDEFANPIPRRRGMAESVTSPKKPESVAKPTENKTTANTMKATPEIKYADKAVDNDMTKTTAEPHEDKVSVPANIMKELKAVISEFEKTAKFANTRDDTKAAFCMTVVEAFRELVDYLELGTVESMKLAQIHMSSLMSPITQHLPDSVKKFVLMGGRKPTLKDLFDSKREDRKGA